MLTDIFDKEIVKLITFDIKSVQKCMYIFEKIYAIRQIKTKLYKIYACKLVKTGV